MNRFIQCIVGLSIALGATGCKEAEEALGQCGLACPGSEGPDGVEIKGVVDGNAAISGIARVDGFFAAVNTFRGAADGVSAGINAELDKIRGDFELGAEGDIGAQLEAKITANVEGSLYIDYQPARCSVDAKATIEAQARCDVDVDPGEVSVECKGSCELEAGAELKCDASAELECTFTGPTVDCQGECSGTCEAKLMGAASCSGTCRGTCSGECSAYSDSAGTQCAGSCSGMCTGTCEATASASAKCTGTCRGECKVSGPDAKCEGSARASCKAKADAKLMCKGKCEGEFEPPMVDAECQATARAEAKVNVQCTPPSVQARYRLKAAAMADVMARAKFEAALKTLVKVRLPALLSATARAKSVAEAGDDLRVAATGAVEASIDAASAKAGIRAKAGLLCALGELPEVQEALSASADSLTESLNASADITTALKM